MNNSVRPLTPDEVIKRKEQQLPGEVTEVFNELIAKYWNGGSATIRQDEAVGMIASRLNVSREYCFANHYLDVEEIFKQAGWEVEYDKPAYCEFYPATFTFRRKR